jgi:hypothetical protein
MTGDLLPVLSTTCWSSAIRSPMERTWLSLFPRPHGHVDALRTLSIQPDKRIPLIVGNFDGPGERLSRRAASEHHSVSPVSLAANFPASAKGPIYQTSFKANWICREVVAVEVI